MASGDTNHNQNSTYTNSLPEIILNPTVGGYCKEATNTHHSQFQICYQPDTTYPQQMTKHNKNNAICIFYEYHVSSGSETKITKRNINI
jgi:hypothetical protein